MKYLLLVAILLILLIPANTTDQVIDNSCTEFHINQTTICIKGGIE